MKDISMVDMIKAISEHSITIIDNDITIRNMIKNTFKSIGINVVNSHSTNEIGLDIPCTSSIYIISLDEPVITSFNIISNIKLNTDCTVVVLSKYIEEEYQNMSKYSGSDYYIHKPIDFINLVETLYEAVEVNNDWYKKKYRNIKKTQNWYNK